MTGRIRARTGTFPRYLAVYVRELGILRWEEAVRKMTSLPAQRLGFLDRGLLRPGLAADVVCVDPETVRDTATYEDPRRLPEDSLCDRQRAPRRRRRHADGRGSRGARSGQGRADQVERGQPHEPVVVEVDAPKAALPCDLDLRLQILD